MAGGLLKISSSLPVQHLNLVLNFLQPLTAQSQQGRAALIACKQLIKGQLACFQLAYELLQLLHGFFIVVGQFFAGFAGHVWADAHCEWDGARP